MRREPALAWTPGPIPLGCTSAQGLPEKRGSWLLEQAKGSHHQVSLCD